MIKLDELKTQVQVHESMQAEYPDLPDHFFEAGVSPKVLGILIETAEIAFEFANQWQDNGHGTYIGKGKVSDFRRLHTQLQNLRKELENE